MKVKCTICDSVEGLDDSSLQAKRLRNRRINLYLCHACRERITRKTEARQATGKFKQYKNKNTKDLI